MDTLGRRLIFARKNVGYTQNSLADAIGVSRGVIYNLEKDKNKPQTIVVNAICQALTIRKEWLLEGVGEMQRETGLTKMLTELLKAAEDLPENELLYLLDTIKTVKTHLIEKNAAATETKKGKKAAATPEIDAAEPKAEPKTTPENDVAEPKKTKKAAAESKKEPKKTATESKRGRKAATEPKNGKKAATEPKKDKKATATPKKEPKKTATEPKKGKKAAVGDVALGVPPSHEGPKDFGVSSSQGQQKTRIFIGAKKMLPIGHARK